jgi:hypothetical protein
MEEKESLWMMNADDTSLGQDSPKSLTEFQGVFPDEDACRTYYLYRARFPTGFECPYCGWTGMPYGFRNDPDMLRCRGCRRNTRLTSGTQVGCSVFQVGERRADLGDDPSQQIGNALSRPGLGDRNGGTGDVLQCGCPLMEPMMLGIQRKDRQNLAFTQTDAGIEQQNKTAGKPGNGAVGG